jgi:hypothetical protein
MATSDFQSNGGSIQGVVWDDRRTVQIGQIEQILRDPASGLQERIVRDIGLFTVGLLRVSRTRESERLDLCGTGTLVSFAGDRYILTAAHVWEKLLKTDAPTSVGVTLRENIDHKSLIERATIVAIAPPKPAKWNEWGPDLVFLRVPPEHVGTIEVHRVFLNLMRNRTAGFNGVCIDLRVLMGTPYELAECTDWHANLQISGMISSTDIGRFSPIQAPESVRRDFDYIDLDMLVALPGVPETFGGVSGGGLWRVFVYWSASTGEIAWAKDIEGVAFHESDLINGHRVIRCHGPQSIGTAVQSLI